MISRTSSSAFTSKRSLALPGPICADPLLANLMESSTSSLNISVRSKDRPTSPATACRRSSFPPARRARERSRRFWPRSSRGKRASTRTRSCNMRRTKRRRSGPRTGGAGARGSSVFPKSTCRRSSGSKERVSTTSPSTSSVLATNSTSGISSCIFGRGISCSLRTARFCFCTSSSRYRTRSSLSRSALRNPSNLRSRPGGPSLATASSRDRTVSRETRRASAARYPRRKVATRSTLR
mmetsp:Transcript_20992/g.47611  ORF Transcript_20992/g.47611 Transcript_20992/m.47611 type:complete len:238 (+) Transcript_20992:181-894(+)